VGIVRKVQAWSVHAIVDEITRSLGNDEEVVQYQVNFVEKFGKPDGIRLPSRRFIPDWTWTDPSPLKRLKDPYDVILAPKDKASADRNASSNGTNTNNQANQGHDHKREASAETPSSGGTVTPSALTYGVGNLPVQHPTLRIRFEPDSTLPPPPALPSFVASQSHPSLHSREASNLFSPSSSRPSSRTGRISNHSHALHPHHYHGDIARSISRPGSTQGSPRRQMTADHASPNLANKFVSLPTSPSGGQFDFVRSNLAKQIRTVWKRM
jgi:hypothetical protein